MLTPSRAKELFEYDPDTGYFLRRTSQGGFLIGTRAGCLCNTSGYRFLGVDGKVYGEHRVAFLIMTGGMACDEVDHINQIKHDNRWENLREVTHLQNMQNTSQRKDNATGITGVYQRENGKYRAAISVNGKKICLGTFEDFNDAVAARKAAQEKYGFHANHGQGA